MSECRLCPRECGQDRSAGVGICGGAALPLVAKTMLHKWEEPFISGERGSGAVFFSGCNMFCQFCQNYAISRSRVGKPTGAAALSADMLALERAGAHNINLVSPSPYADVVADAIVRARAEGLAVPIVYNTNAYEKVETLKLLDGLVDVYLPDMKYVSREASTRFSLTADYFEYAAPAVLEMRRQQSEDIFEDGLIKKGLVVRHLVLPGAVDETRRVLRWLYDELGGGVRLSLMGQYTPAYRATEGALSRRLTRGEYSRAKEYALRLGFTNVLVQTPDSADASFTPDFAR